MYFDSQMFRSSVPKLLLPGALTVKMHLVLRGKHTHTHTAVFWDFYSILCNWAVHLILREVSERERNEHTHTHAKV